MYGLIGEVLDHELKPKSSRIGFDFSRLNFVDASAVTVLSNLILYLKQHGVRVGYYNYKYDKEGNKYLDDSGFFAAHLGKKIFANSALRETTFPLQEVRHDVSFSWIFNKFTPWIAGRTQLPESSFGLINVCLGEIFNNILDHSGQKVGCAFAQHYPQQKEVMLSISDFGVGIPHNVRKVLPNISDDEAIAQAVIEGFTTKSTQRNRGAGLHILTRNIVGTNQGEINVHSLKGRLQSKFIASGPRHLPNMTNSPYPGTLIEISFKTGMLNPITEKEDFQW
jgi:anti-sigma regulatory factor (Ser/Thr protein kinase)